MKKIISLLLLPALLLSLAACGGAGTGKQGAKGFRVGYARVDITPTESVPLAGYGSTSKRMAQNILDPLYVTCVAMTDESDNTVLMMSMDLIRTPKTFADSARAAINRNTGVPVENIYITSTHTHAGPDTDNVNEPSIITYSSFLQLQVRAAAEAALADRKSAKLYTARVDTENMTFVRHYKHTASDGTVKYFGDNFGKSVIDSTTAHATEVDSEMRLVKITREGGKDIIMANFQGHPTFMGGSGKFDVSADYVGAFRLSMEKLTGCQFVYFQGAAGNLNTSSRITSEVRTKDMYEYAAILTDYAMQGLETLTPVENTAIATRKTLLKAEVNHSTDHLFADAKKLSSSWNAGNGLGIRSVYHARAIVTRYNMGPSIDLELNAISVGDALAFVTAPGELFDTNAMYVRANAGFGTVFTLELCNAHEGYVPSSVAFDYTCYESDCTRVTKGTGEAIQDAFLQMLGELAGEK